MRFGVRTDRGKVRRVNEDTYCFRDFRPRVEAVLAAVADGMGGHLGGDVASRLAVEILLEVVERELAQVAVDTAAVLPVAFEEANRRVFAAARGDPAQEGMGTTLTASLCHGDTVEIGHLGDSRAYLVRGGAIHQLTSDHTLVNAMVKNGELTEEEAMLHPQRNLLTRALGTEAVAVADFSRHRLQPGDLLVLCTDGLHSLVDRREILALVVDRDPHEAADRLVRLAMRRGGYDNVTVLVYEPLAVPEGGRAP